MKLNRPHIYRSPKSKRASTFIRMDQIESQVLLHHDTHLQLSFSTKSSDYRIRISPEDFPALLAAMVSAWTLLTGGQSPERA
jgi:hypothetical protein